MKSGGSAIRFGCASGNGPLASLYFGCPSGNGPLASTPPSSVFALAAAAAVPGTVSAFKAMKKRENYYRISPSNFLMYLWSVWGQMATFVARKDKKYSIW